MTGNVNGLSAIRINGVGHERGRGMSLSWGQNRPANPANLANLAVLLHKREGSFDRSNVRIIFLSY